ncbi:cardiolipin synthase [Bacillus songklensis]|uniref:Cardiolipin synthase n=1 Tax=Bacillus songklensis TaxID=1069116 RepID=A0ABV8B7S4_9BACI
MDILVYVLSFFGVLNLLLAVTIIFLERRNVAATWAWLLVLFFIPIAGFFLYIIFGQNLSKRKIFKLTTQQKREFGRELEEQKQLIEVNQMRYSDPSTVQYESLIYMNVISGYSLLTQDNDIEIFTDGHDKFDALLESIDHAQDHIHLVYYIFRNDHIGKRVLDALTEKARDGVEVRILYDDMGCSRVPKRFFKPLIEAGGEVAIFFPSRILPFLNFRVNYRNHRKIVIIDGKIGYVGGFNIGDEYLGLNKKFGYWRDTHLKVAGSAVDTLQTRFFLDWNSASPEKSAFEKRYYPLKKSNGSTAVQILSSGPDSEWHQIRNGILKMIYSAKKSIDIQTPYFVPDESVMNALKIAAVSGVDVRIMIPNKPDHMFVYWATYSYVGELLDAGAKCYKYDNGFIHAKTIVVDGEVASVGTANFDVRSFKLNFEVNAFIYGTNAAKRLENIFEDDILRSTELTKEMYDQRSRGIKFKESISRLLSPIL